MKSIISLSLILFLVIVTIEHSSSSNARKRYYDSWEANNNGASEPLKPTLNRYKSLNKYDPCENKPLWFLKSQARLGKLSPFYDCINEHRAE
ncbi:hypothetical protein I4U23_024362 [Adineta vaga]|nr:hypothetical protein I4U23_024362 [Adineta vaga]